MPCGLLRIDSALEVMLANCAPELAVFPSSSVEFLLRVGLEDEASPAPAEPGRLPSTIFAQGMRELGRVLAI
jgi:hypothetical protein